MEPMRAVVVGASAEAVHAIAVARDLGFEVTAFDGDPHAEGLRHADDARVVDITVPSAIVDAFPGRPDVVLPVPIGRYLTSTGAVNDYWGLPGVTADAAANCTDKWRFHEMMARHGFRRAPGVLIPPGESPRELPVDYPVVLKPRFGSGSRAVSVFTSRADLETYLDRLGPVAEDLLIEECAQGVEYGLDAAVAGGEFHMILLREKLLTRLPYRQAVGYYSVPHDDSNATLYRSVAVAMSRVCELLGLKDCLLHADLVWDGDSIFVIEVSARPSGHHLHDLFTPLATGVDPVREFIKFAVPGLGQEYSFTPRSVRPLLIRFFDFNRCTVVAAPDASTLRDRFPLLAYEEHCAGRHMEQVTDGPGLMGRGYFVLAGDSRAELEENSIMLLNEFTLEKDPS